MDPNSSINLINTFPFVNISRKSASNPKDSFISPTIAIKPNCHIHDSCKAIIIKKFPFPQSHSQWCIYVQRTSKICRAQMRNRKFSIRNDTKRIILSIYNGVYCLLQQSFFTLISYNLLDLEGHQKKKAQFGCER